MSDSNWFGDLNRDRRADGRDDLLAFWFFEQHLQQQRQRATPACAFGGWPKSWPPPAKRRAGRHASTPATRRRMMKTTTGRTTMTTISAQRRWEDMWDDEADLWAEDDDRDED